VRGKHIYRRREGPRQWKRNSGGDNSRPSSDANRRPIRFCSRRWIPDGARAARVGAAADTGGRRRRAAAAARHNVEAASCGAALPSQPRGTASEATAAGWAQAAAVVAAASAGSAPWLANQSRWMLVASFSSITVTASASLGCSFFLLSP